MAPSYCIELTRDEQAQLLVIARGSIESGLVANRPLDIAHSGIAGALTKRHGNFVTLTQRGTLRGCVGTIQGTRPLAQNIAVSAYNAAYRDTRFSPLSADEIDQTRIEISVLTQPEPIAAGTHEELLANLHPNEDGLLMENAGHQTTFLPKVWEKVPDPQQFVQQLMVKAGLPGDYWSETIRFHRYQTISFSESTTESAH